MNKLIYVLANGTEVTTLKEAKASGQTYKTTTRFIADEKTPLSAKRQELLSKYGVVVPQPKFV